jgi:hypothetical protein
MKRILQNSFYEEARIILLPKLDKYTTTTKKNIDQ